jgi:osmotically-inducible protein OsmY
MQKKVNSSNSNATAKAPFTDLAGKPSSPEIDKKIVSTFKNSYVYKTFLTADSVEATAQNGIVTLTGTVEDESHKTLAQETIARVQGVVRVNNQLVTPSEAAAENADKWIARKVKLSLIFHFHVSAMATTVEVKDRVVTLKGEATSMAQKELTSEYAGDIEGVKAVLNEMTVAKTPQPAKRSADERMDDASLFAQVYSALLLHRSTSAMKTSVEIRDGVVSLTGIVKNPAEKALVTKIVSDIHGVTSVNNQMTIEEQRTI